MISFQTAFYLIISLIVLSRGEAYAERPAGLIGQKWDARDSLNIGQEANDDARQCLETLTWQVGEFQVDAIAPGVKVREEVVFTFPSPMGTPSSLSETVYLEGYLATAPDGEISQAPAVVVIHESGRKMPVGRMIAQGFRQRGIHAFLLQLPGYGYRRSAEKTENIIMSKTFRQGVTDVRRAYDAVAALPFVNREKISLQGTSLGGFVCSLTAGIDRAYDSVFLLLSGGDVFEVLQNGTRDAAKFRELAKSYGLSDDQLRSMTREVEPNRLAHRVNPERTWLYSGVFDQVVPIANARSYAKAAQLPESHHVLLPADHFTGILLLPAVLDQMSQQILTGRMDQADTSR